MKFLICRPLAALFVAAAVLTASLALANIDVGGVDFKSQDSVENTHVELNGAGLRTRLTFKVYAMGLYLRQPATTTTATSLRPTTARTAVFRSCIISTDRALSAAGRLRVRVATPSVTSSNTVFAILRCLHCVS